MTMNTLRLAARQRGIALMLVLVFLVVLTMLGTTALRTARIEEQLAGSTYDRLVARSAGDAALADAFDYANAPGFDPASPALAPPMLSSEANDGYTIITWRKRNTNWYGTGGSPSTTALSLGSGGAGSTSLLQHVNKNPSYIVESLPTISGDTTYGTVWIRITARAVGGRTTTENYTQIIMPVQAKLNQ
jgi:type IV pilus assembly protein PilX